MKILRITVIVFMLAKFAATAVCAQEKTRVIVTSDGEIDDECSLVRFLLYANEWEVEGIITSSSQYHWRGHKWAGDNWAQPYLKAYEKIYPNLLLHDQHYPSPAYLQSVTLLGNVDAEGEMDQVTAGSTHIANLLLDSIDARPIWIQAWGGTNTIARALKTIEEKHPDQMARVAGKMRLYLIWEQDSTYQSYIRPHWEKFNMPVIISDQFIALFYHWKKYLPARQQSYLAADWMNQNILKNHGALCSLYKAHQSGDKGFEEGDFRSEGDSPAFLHTIPTGLRSLENPGWGGWGGQFVRVRANTWLDPVQESGYQYPAGRWYGNSAWGRERLRKEIPNDTALSLYLKQQWRWIEAMQNDFAARADWSVQDYAHANHPPVVKVNMTEYKARAGEKIKLHARGSSDPDGNQLSYRWWIYEEAGNYKGRIRISEPEKIAIRFKVPGDATKGNIFHLICEVTDNGSPKLTRYQRVLIQVN